MLKYKLKPISVKDGKEIKYRDLYISPDMSFISGKTDYLTDLHDGDMVSLQNPKGDTYNPFTDMEHVQIHLEDVRVNGRVNVRMELPVKTITKKMSLPINYDSDNNEFVYINNRKVYISNDYDKDDVYGGYFTSVTQNYVEYNGNISYFFNGENNTGYLVKDKFYQASSADTSLVIDDYLYIEDYKIIVGDKTYDVIFDDVNTGDAVIKLNKYSDKIQANDILGTIDDYTCIAGHYSGDTSFVTRYNSREYKFTLYNNNSDSIDVEDVLYAGYRHYITYDGEQIWLSRTYDKDGIYLGYGVMINGQFYPVDVNVYDDEYISDVYWDDDLSMSYVLIDNETYEIYSVPRAITNGGKYAFIITYNESLPINGGDILSAEASFANNSVEYVNFDDDGTPYITHMGVRYEVQDHAFDVVQIAGTEYRLTYTSAYTKAYIEIDSDNIIYFDIDTESDEIKATQSNDIYYLDESEENPSIKYGKRQNAYDVIYNSGVTIGDNIYKVIDNIYYTETESGETIDMRETYVQISEQASYELNVFNILGSATYMCSPIVKNEDLTLEQADTMARYIVDDIVTNKGNFSFKLKSNAFSGVQVRPDASLLASMSTQKPMEEEKRSDAYKNIRISYMSRDLLVQFPLPRKIGNDLMHGDIIQNVYAENLKQGLTNNIVDMEKDVYYPVYDVTPPFGHDACDKIFKDIDEIRFNFHFRTRNLDNWKILDDTAYDSGMTNWFITDYSIYNEPPLGNRKNYNIVGFSKHNASDLIGFANFTTSEVRNMAKKIANSFLRVSFYSTNNPNTQVLLGTSSIYLDEMALVKKYTSCMYAASLDFIDVSLYETDTTPTSSAVTPVWKNTYTSALSELYGDVHISDNNRLSTRIRVFDKHRTDVSSEGFYQYLYKEYSKGARETVIYARFEFNHAGLGQSIPFIIPRKNVGKVNESPMYIFTDDLATMKEGFPMSDIYKQLYFPIHIKYDNHTNRYVYWIPNNLRENSALHVEDNIMEFNLFEVKFKDESFEPKDDNEGN